MKYSAIHQYCEDHAQELDHQLNESAYEIFTRHYHAPFFLLLIIAIVNSGFIGVIALKLLALPALFVILPALWVKVWGPTLVQRMARTYLYFTANLILCAIGSVFAYAIYMNQNPDLKPPIEIALCIGNIFVTYSLQRRRIIVLSLLNTCSFALPFLVLAPDILITSYYQFIGGQGVGFAIAMGLHYHRKMNFFVQHVARSLNYHLLAELESMVYPHQIRMIQDKSSVKETMNLEPGLGVMGEFDIINSSEMGHHEAYHQTKNTIFRLCYDRLLANYRINEEDLVHSYSDGHLVKEMGDGFIFSVGYPFQMPDGKDATSVSIEIALDFIRLFHEHASGFSAPESPSCVVVMTRGQLESFWTQFRINRYDFKQSFVTPVIRLQDLRRELGRRGVIEKGESFVLIDDNAYFALPPKLQEIFKPIALQTLGLHFRGRPNATHVFYHPVRQTRRLKSAG